MRGLESLCSYALGPVHSTLIPLTLSGIKVLIKLLSLAMRDKYVWVLSFAHPHFFAKNPLRILKSYQNYAQQCQVIFWDTTVGTLHTSCTICGGRLCLSWKCLQFWHFVKKKMKEKIQDYMCNIKVHIKVHPKEQKMTLTK